MIAMGLINDPSLLIADEPTTALDVTVQAQILDLLQDLQREFNSAIIIITHDLGVIAEMADDVLVMYGGRAVEYGTCRDVLTRPEMPYTWGLLSSVPDVTADTSARMIPIPGNPPSLLDPPTRLRVPPAVRAPRQGPGRPLRHDDARPLPGTAAPATSAVPPGGPRRGLRGRGPSRDRPRTRRGDPMTQDPDTTGSPLDPAEQGVSVDLAVEETRWSSSRSSSAPTHAAAELEARRRAGADRREPADVLPGQVLR